MKLNQITNQTDEGKRFIDYWRNNQYFNVFFDINYKTADARCLLKDLKKYIVQTGIPVEDKKSRNVIHFNRFVGFAKDQQNALYPIRFMLDIDGKNPYMMARLILDMGIENPTGIELEPSHLELLDDKSEKFKPELRYELDELTRMYIEALDVAYHRLKNLGIFFYLDFSQSGLGIHAMLDMTCKFVKDNINRKPTDEDFYPEYIPQIMQAYFEAMLELIRPAGFNFRNNEQWDYIDARMKGIHMGALSSNGRYFHIDEQAPIIVCPFTPISVELENSNENEKESRHEKMDKDLLKYNEMIAEEIWNIIQNKNINRIEYNNLITTSLKYFEFTELWLIFSIKYTDPKWWSGFHHLYKYHYHGNHPERYKDLKSFTRYVKSAKASNKETEYVSDLRRIFPRLCYQLEIARDGYDNYDNKFTEELEYDGDKYLASIEDELFKRFDDNDKIVLRAATGSGKSHETIKYLFRTLAKGANRVSICSPLNKLCEQQVMLLHEYIKENGITDVVIIKNYDRIKPPPKGNPKNFKPTIDWWCNQHNVYDASYDYEGKKVIAVSSTPKLRYIKGFDLLVIDEVHNLISFADKILSIIPYVKKTIFISANPERYMLFNDGIYYLNCKDINFKKKDLMVVYTEEHLDILQMILDANRKKKILILWLDIDKSKKFLDGSGHQFTYINSRVKSDPHTLEVINNQKLFHDKYCCTNIVSDGINILNQHWDYIICVDIYGSLESEMIMQAVSRFRKASPKNILITKYRFTHDVTVDFEKFKDDKEFKEFVDRLSKKLPELNRDKSNNKYTQLIRSKYYIKDTNDEYIQNPDAIRKMLLMRYFIDLYRDYRDVFENALGKYFNLEIKYPSIQATTKVVNTPILNNFFLKHHKIVWEEMHGTFYWDEGMCESNPDDTALIKTIRDNHDYFSMLVERCDELKQISVDWKNYKSLVIANQNVFTKFLERETKRSIMGVKDANHMNSVDKTLWDNKNRINQFISKSKFRKRYVSKMRQFDYFTVEDLLIALKDDRSAYESFRNIDDEYYFTLDVISIGLFLGVCNTVFEKTSIPIDKKHVGVYKLLEPYDETN